MDFNPMMAPPPMAAAPAKKGGNTTLYIVIFFLCVISVMAGAFYFQTQSAAAKAAAELEKIRADTAAKMAAAQSDFEKQQIQAEAAEKTRSAQLKAEFAGKEAALEAKAKGKEAQLKALEAKVNADLAAAAKTVKNANALKAKAANERNAAVKRLREANAAKKKAEASGKAIDKKLADEKAKLARDAAKKVAAANKKAADAVKKAKAEAKKAKDVKKKLDKANATLAGVEFKRASPYGAVPGYKYPGRKGAGIVNKFNVTDPNVCKRLARAQGATVWGHRNIKQGNKTYRNSCFFYTVDTSKKYAGDKNDTIHMIGCTYGGNPKTKCKANPYKDTSGKDTPDNNWGNGNSIYLDRHRLNCGRGGIQRFQLKRPSGDEIDYKYTCVPGVNASQSGWKYTASNDWGGGNMIYLDRHTVDCGRKPISDLQLKRPAWNKIRYHYRCSNRNAAGDCRNTATGWNTPSSSTIYLDRHNVKCKPNEVLTKFRLRHNGQSGSAKKIRYDYTCCAM
jgi:hypothetical protein